MYYVTYLCEQGRAEAKAKDEPLRIMIAGAPASGKGTQCELIVEKVGFLDIHIIV